MSRALYSGAICEQCSDLGGFHEQAPFFTTAMRRHCQTHQSASQSKPVNQSVSQSVVFRPQYIWSIKPARCSGGSSIAALRCWHGHGPRFLPVSSVTYWVPRRVQLATSSSRSPCACRPILGMRMSCKGWRLCKKGGLLKQGLDGAFLPCDRPKCDPPEWDLPPKCATIPLASSAAST